MAGAERPVARRGFATAQRDRPSGLHHSARRGQRGAYQSGYQAAYTGYQDLSARYVAELRKPRITLGRSISLIAAAGAGFVIARATRE